MSEEKQKSSFMLELDKWSEAEIISPLLYAGAESVEDEDFDYALIGEEKKKLIRTKMLESYRNGLAVGRREADGPSRPEYPRKGYQQKTEVKTSRWPIRA